MMPLTSAQIMTVNVLIGIITDNMIAGTTVFIRRGQRRNEAGWERTNAK